MEELVVGEAGFLSRLGEFVALREFGIGVPFENIEIAIPGKPTVEPGVAVDIERSVRAFTGAKEFLVLFFRTHRVRPRKEKIGVDVREGGLLISRYGTTLENQVCGREVPRYGAGQRTAGGVPRG